MASGEKKRHRQSLDRNTRNHSEKSRIKTLMKKVEGALEGEDTAAAESFLRTAISALHKAGQKRVIPHNAAARHVGQLSKLGHRKKGAAASS